MRAIRQAFVFFALFALGCGLRISPAAPVAGIVGQPYRRVFAIDRRSTPVGGVEVTRGALPPGLEVRHDRMANTFVIEGTPREQGHYEFTLYVWCYGTNFGGKTLEENWSIDVNP